MNSLQHLPLNTSPMKEIDSSITQYSNSILWKGLSTYKGVICIVLGYLMKRNKLGMIDKWYKKTGCIFEFFNPKDEISLFYLH